MSQHLYYSMGAGTTATTANPRNLPDACNSKSSTHLEQRNNEKWSCRLRFPGIYPKLISLATASLISVVCSL
jgi:hypothetical protein